MVSVATTICDEKLWRVLKDTTPGRCATLDEGEFKEQRAIFDYNATVRAGMETRCTHLFSGGVEFLYKSKKMLQGDASRWALCGKQFLTAYVRDGIVLATVGQGSRSPEVLDPQLYHIEVFFSHDGWRAYYVIPRGRGAQGVSVPMTSGSGGGGKRKRSSSQKKNIQVTVFEGFPPLVTGKLNSPIKVLAPLESLVRSLQQCWIVAEMHRCQPKVFSTSIDPTPLQRSINRDYNVHGEADVVASQKKLETEEMGIAAFAQFQLRENAMNAELANIIDSTSAEDSADIDPATGGSMRAVNPSARPGFAQIHPVEPGRTVVAGPPASSPSLILELMKFKCSESAKIIGVPLDLTGNGGGHAVNVNIMHVFYNTVKQDRTILRLFYQVMFYIIHGDDVFGNASKDLLMETQFSEEVLAKVAQEHEFVVAFNATMDPLVLDREYQRKSFTGETYAKLTAAYHGIDIKLFDVDTLEKVRQCEIQQMVSATEQMKASAQAAKTQAAASAQALTAAAPARPLIKAPTKGKAAAAATGKSSTASLYNKQAPKTDRSAARYGAGLSSTSTSVQSQAADPPPTSSKGNAYLAVD